MADTTNGTAMAVRDEQRALLGSRLPGFPGFPLRPAGADAVRFSDQALDMATRDADGVADLLCSGQLAGVEQPTQPLPRQSRLSRSFGKPDQFIVSHIGAFYAPPVKCSTNLVAACLFMVESGWRTATRRTPRLSVRHAAGLSAAFVSFGGF